VKDKKPWVPKTELGRKIVRERAAAFSHHGANPLSAGEINKEKNRRSELLEAIMQEIDAY
jgi:hypothetical protein